MKHPPLLYLLLTAVLLSGCGKKEISPPTTVTTTATRNTTVATEPTIPSPPPEVDEEYSGTLTDTHYANGYIGIACDLSGDWQVSRDESDTDDPELNQFYDLRAENTLTKATVHVVLTALSEMEQTAYANASEEEIVDLILTNTASLTQSYEAAGMTVKSITRETVTFLGQERLVVYTVCDLKGVDYYTAQLVRYDLGSWGVTITAAGFTPEAVDATLALFYSV